jgi:hypothetical protein
MSVSVNVNVLIYDFQREGFICIMRLWCIVEVAEPSETSFEASSANAPIGYPNITPPRCNSSGEISRHAMKDSRVSHLCIEMLH